MQTCARICSLEAARATTACPHNESIFTCICTTRPSSTWCRGVGMFHRPLLKAATHHRYTVPNNCSNPPICPSRFPQAYNATPFKWLRLFNMSTFSSVWHDCTESSTYYARLQTAVARGLDWPASGLMGRHTAAAPKHSLCFSVQFLSNWSRASTYISKV